MANADSHSLDELRANLTEQETELLKGIWDYLTANGKWIPTRVLHQKYGRNRARDALSRLGGSIVLERTDDGKERYCLSLLGIMLTSIGQQAEQLLVRYLMCLSERFLTDPEIEKMSSEEITRSLNLDANEVVLLGRLLDVGLFLHAGASGLGTLAWTVGVPRNIDEIAECQDISAFLHSKLMDSYDPKMPVFEGMRSGYVLRRERRELGRPGSEAEAPALSRHPEEENAGLQAVTKSTSARECDVFICHADVDKRVAGLLKRHFEHVDKKLEVFVASHPASLPAGHEWWDEIREHLRSAKVVLTIVSAESKNRPWIYFESGGAFFRGALVVPLVIPPETKGLQPPLGVLQALDLSSLEDIGALFRQLGARLSVKFGQEPDQLWKELRELIPESKARRDDERGQVPRSAKGEGSDSLLESETRTRRGIVLGKLQGFTDLVHRVCGGLTIQGAVKKEFMENIGIAAEQLRYSREEQSQWIGPEWVEKIDKLERLGWQIVNSFAAAYELSGPTSVHFMEQGSRKCKEFEALYQGLRSGANG